jgi:hypothetical protein
VLEPSRGSRAPQKATLIIGVRLVVHLSRRQLADLLVNLDAQPEVANWQIDQELTPWLAATGICITEIPRASKARRSIHTKECPGDKFADGS